ncbi:MAG: T9SS type A sorting domain-containing protein [Flavobacteriales bacterium]
MKSIFILLLTISVFTLNAQIDKRRVIASAGRIAKNITPTMFGTNYIMSYTLGEPFIYVNTPIGYTNVRMCNGFQQPNALIPVGPGTSAMLPSNPVFNIYPNPFDSYSIIEAPKEYEEQELKLQLIDANGKLVYDEIMKGGRHKADYSTGLAPGTYFLNIYQLTGEFIHQVKLIKS